MNRESINPYIVLDKFNYPSWIKFYLTIIVVMFCLALSTMPKYFQASVYLKRARIFNQSKLFNKSIEFYNKVLVIVPNSNIARFEEIVVIFTAKRIDYYDYALNLIPKADFTTEQLVKIKYCLDDTDKIILKSLSDSIYRAYLANY